MCPKAHVITIPGGWSVPKLGGLAFWDRSILPEESPSGGPAWRTVSSMRRSPTTIFTESFAGIDITGATALASGGGIKVVVSDSMHCGGPPKVA
jgi:hypothetical protein